MYGKLLTLTFEEARDEYAGIISNCNSARLLITFNGHNTDLDTVSVGSDIIILYDMVDRKPLMLIERAKRETVDSTQYLDKMENLNKEYMFNVSGSGDGVYQDITIIRRTAYETLTAEC